MQIINNTIVFVKDKLTNAESGHDWFHIERVYKNALLIAEEEECDLTVVKLAALLHDIADSKFNHGDDTIGPKLIHKFLTENNLDSDLVDKIIYIVENMSFKHSFHFDQEKSLEFQIVQDADRLDAIGAIGIARAFSYGGFKGHIFYNPEVKPQQFTDSEQYKKATTPTINHFYEKLLLLKDQMNTTEGKLLAEERHAFMLDFLEQFYNEWEGKK